MFSDSVEETLTTLTMGDPSLEQPPGELVEAAGGENAAARAASPPPAAEVPPPPPLSSSSPGLNKPPPTPPPQCPSTTTNWGEVVNFSDSGFGFYPNVIDNAFPYSGILHNERRFSSSSPTSNTSFLSETSFNNAQPHLKNNQDSGLPSDNFGLPNNNNNNNNNCSPFQGNAAATPTNSNGHDFPGNLSCGGGSFTSLANDHYLGGDQALALFSGGGSNNNNNSNTNGPNVFNDSGNGSGLNDSANNGSSNGLNDSANGGGTGFNDSGLSSMGAATSSIKWDTPKTYVSTPGNHNNNNQFDFSFFDAFSISGSGSGGGAIGSSNGTNSSDASADSPTRNLAHELQNNFGNQWNFSEISALLDDHSRESASSKSLVVPSALGNSIWSPSRNSTATTGGGYNGSANMNGNNNGAGASNGSGNAYEDIDDLQMETTLANLTKQQLMEFNQILLKAHHEHIEKGEIATAEKVQAIQFQLSQFIIKAFVPEAGSLCDFNVSPSKSSETSPLFHMQNEQCLEDAAEMHRGVDGSMDAPYTWSGQLPPRIHRHPVTYSCKVFLGGLPFDITEQTLIQAFKPFGNVKIEWPGKDGSTTKIKGFAYAILESEKMVKLLLQSCTHDYSTSRAGYYFYPVSSRRYRNKDVQIIPWAMTDSNFVRCQPSQIDPLRTIFVGALHGMVNAEGLATIMNDLFGGVVYAGIDTCKLKYPIGSARVTFNNDRSYMKAVRACFVYIKTARFKKKVQVDPYLEDSTCSVCKLQQGPYFCRDKLCFSYFCRTCFQQKHAEGHYRSHRPMMRTMSNKQGGGSQNGSLTPKFYQGGVDSQLRFDYQQQQPHNQNNMVMMMNGGGSSNGRFHNNGNGYNNNYSNGFYNNHGNNNNNRRWTHSNNGGHQRYQQWSNGGGAEPSSSPPFMMNNGNGHGQGLYSGNGKAHLSSGEFFGSLDIPNQGSDFGGVHHHHQQQHPFQGHGQQYGQQSYNNHRNNLGNNGGGFRRQQQQQMMRFQ